jgi:hypothetical protein
MEYEEGYPKYLVKFDKVVLSKTEESALVEPSEQKELEPKLDTIKLKKK